jgi:serine/alanine adding enzyme
MRAEFVNDDHAAEWDAFVASRVDSALYHFYRWRKVFTQVFRRETLYVVARDSSGAIRGVLPVARLKSRVFGDFLVSLPYFNYGGALAENDEAHRVLIDAMVDKARALGVRHLELRHQAPCLERWPVRHDKVTMILPLPGTVEELSKRLGSKIRAQIKRPEKEGATAELGGIELLPEFHAVLACNMRDLGTPSYPLSFFRGVCEVSGDDARVALVRLQGRAVAAALVLRHRQTLEIPWASSLREVNRTGVNMLLYWRVLQHAVSLGLREFDFGRCTVDSGTYKFKQQWGAEPRQLYWHYWLANAGELPQLNPNNPKYAMAVAVWRKLPVPVASWLSRRIIGNLP